MRLQLDSSRTASGPALLARGSAARQSRPSRRTAVETPALRRVKRRRRICVARNAASPMRSYEAPPAPRRMSRRAQPRAGGWNGREERREVKRCVPDAFTPSQCGVKRKNAQKICRLNPPEAFFFRPRGETRSDKRAHTCSSGWVLPRGTRARGILHIAYFCSQLDIG